MQRDLYHNVLDGVIFEPAETTASTVLSSAVDCQGFRSGIFAGYIDTDGEGTAKLVECDTSGGTYTDVAADDVIGTQGDDLVPAGALTLGYVGSKRYVKLSITVTTAGIVAAYKVMGDPLEAKTR